MHKGMSIFTLFIEIWADTVQIGGIDQRRVAQIPGSEGKKQDDSQFKCL